MQAVEFETKIENGAIAIPPQYQQTFGNSAQVKVILLMPEPLALDEEEDMIANLLDHPLDIDNFMPKTREELYDR
ncbi:MAG: hypothetical protein DCF21_08550 [Leptolyngbya sp.]|jgi:hypothetical protein|uniref:Uncharacterized protein n=1 Tax=Shackletoniella antarctica TaxID=268115 RepID=A0A2W4VZR7_9CYAN|nr:MAG: hypothetical protein DCF17_14670 [Shackletoniella antarctica]PZV18135.1 MAG: hypothetical protein DCF21_08550 [Leptolyngbya sp.]